MRFYDPNPVKEMNYVRSWNPPMEDGAGIGNLNDTFSGLGVNDSSSKDSIFQVMKAVEDAEHTIKKQVEENNELRTELLRRTRELEKYKSDATALRSSSGVMRDENMSGPYNAHLSTSPLGSEAEKLRWMDNGSSSVSQGSSAIQNGLLKSENTSLQANAGTRHYLETIRLNETSKVVPSVPVSVGNAGFSQLSSPSSRSVSPSRNRKEGEYDSRLNIGSHGLMQISEINSSSSLWKQDLVLKVREHEEEIVQLRRHLAEYSMKEAQIRNEKYVLEKRIAHMRMAFDQQQQDLVDAASKALSYRQDIIEENIRLTYALQAAQQERSTFISALMPLLTEYGLQPPVPDAPSIVSNLKALFKHLQEKLIITEDKLKESQYQLAPWHAEISNNSTFTPQSPSHSFGAALTTSNKPGLEIVAQPSYSYPQLPVSSPSNAQSRADWDTLGQQSYPMGSIGVSTKNLDNENMGRSSPIVSRNSMVDVPARVAVTQSDSHVVRFSEETKSQNPLFKDLVRGNDMDDSEAVEVAQGREASAHWSSTGSSPYMASRDDPNSTYPYLPPVLEEPSSSFSEAAEDDPLPAIEGLQIAGDAFPGRELQASGYSINGTTSCNFEWVRYLEDGSVNYIDGAKQPKYLVTADDVDSYLAIEVQPLDNRKRKGELVKVFANEQRKIACDPEMQVQLESALSLGHASFEVSLSAGVLNIWEHAILAIKRDGYSIKCNGTRGVVVMEKFSPTTVIAIPYGHATEFHIHGASGAEHVLKTGDNSSLRDTVVLTMRLFIMRAVEKRKGRKKVLFFK